MVIKEDSLTLCMEALSDVSREFKFLNDHKDILSNIKKRHENHTIMLPIVGEYNSGKSSLINRVLNVNLLPVDILPATSTIYEIQFSGEKDVAQIFADDGAIETLEDLEQLKNIDTTKAALIKVSMKLDIFPKEILLVDTPGLSSNITAHEKTVLDYAPQSDALLLTIDANQGFTKTTLEFLKIVNSFDKQKRVYIVLTRAESKSTFEINDLKDYATSKLEIKPHKVIVTSAKEGRVGDFKALIDEIYKGREDILKENTRRDLTNIANEVFELIDLQISSSNLNTGEIDSNIKKVKVEMDSLKNEIRAKIDETEERVRVLEKKSVTAFENYMKKEIDHLVNIAFKKYDELEKTFDDSIRKASEHAVKGVYQKELEDITKDLVSAIEDITRRIDIGHLYSINVIKLTSEAVTVVLLNFIIPGGAIEAVLGRIVIKFASRWPSIQKIWNQISRPITDIVEKGAQIISRSFVKKSINTAIQDASDAFGCEIKAFSNEFAEKLKKEILGKFSDAENRTVSTLNSLITEREKQKSEFEKYLACLEDGRLKVEGTIGTLGANV